MRTPRPVPDNTYFYPRPPRGGRRRRVFMACGHDLFLSTPSSRRATGVVQTADKVHNNFYPRPPRGGRQRAHDLRTSTWVFLSTPSSRRATGRTAIMVRATILISIHALLAEGDPACARLAHVNVGISIHALLAEGDTGAGLPTKPADDFYPRPPRGGRPVTETRLDELTRISIHALLAEGDPTPSSGIFTAPIFLSTPSSRRATTFTRSARSFLLYFYPRPPRGGRPFGNYEGVQFWQFLSTPSSRRATRSLSVLQGFHPYFYPRPPRGGRLPPAGFRRAGDHDFYPRPPRGGRLGDSSIKNLYMGISIHALLAEGDESWKPFR